MIDSSITAEGELEWLALRGVSEKALGGVRMGSADMRGFEGLDVTFAV